MTRLSDVINQKIEQYAGAMEALAKGDEMDNTAGWKFDKEDLDYIRAVYSVHPMVWDVLDEIERLNSQLAEARARLAGYEWIPVSERLPEDEGEYLVWFNTNEQGVCEYHKDYPKNNSFFNITPVTHWMPLPEAPKEDE